MNRSEDPAASAAVGTQQDDTVVGRRTRSESLVESVRRLILEDIVRGIVPPGTLLQAADLASDYRVSRTPVREALALLQRQGLVTAMPYRGYLVAGIEPRDVHNVYQVRRIIEGAAVELAATRANDDFVNELRHAQSEDAGKSVQEHHEDARRFHRAIVRLAENPRLVTIFDDVYDDVRRIHYAGFGDVGVDANQREHEAIIDAMISRDPPRARQLMENHIDALRTRALQNWVGEFH